MKPSLLSTTGKLYRSLNSRLLDEPPPCVEQTGDDVCFLGRNGESDAGQVVYCKDLPAGMRCVLASWYISPEKHVVEIIVVTIVASLTIFNIVPKLSRYPQHQSLRPPNFIKLVTAICFSAQFFYKTAVGYPGKWYFVFMPCNTLWVVAMILCFLPNLSDQASHIICQLWISYTGLVFVAIATPDLTDLLAPGEVAFFYISHICLLFFPLYYTASQKVLVSPQKGETLVGSIFKWWCLSCAVFALYYFPIVSPISAYSGFNLNFMMNPPPSPGDVVSGPNFRILASMCCALLFFIMRLLVLLMELTVSAISRVIVVKVEKKDQ